MIQLHAQRTSRSDRRRPQHPALVGGARPFQAQRLQVWLRCRLVRCLHHARGWRGLKTCVTPIAAVANKAITTIEGLGTPEDLHPLQAAWHEHAVPQCGYCQSGQIMAAAALLDANPNPSSDEIDAAMAGNICRCGCYPRIKRAIQSVSENALAYDAMAQTEGRA